MMTLLMESISFFLIKLWPFPCGESNNTFFFLHFKTWNDTISFMVFWFKSVGAIFFCEDMISTAVGSPGVHERTFFIFKNEKKFSDPHVIFITDNRYCTRTYIFYLVRTYLVRTTYTYQVLANTSIHINHLATWNQDEGAQEMAHKKNHLW